MKECAQLNKKFSNLINRGSDLDGQNKNLLSSKLEGKEDVAELKNSIGTFELIAAKSQSGNVPVDGNKNEQPSTSVKIEENTSELKSSARETSELKASSRVTCELIYSSRRPIKRPKRFLSDDSSDDDKYNVKPKVQKCESFSSVSKRVTKHSKTSLYNTDNKNLSTVEENILEMKSKINVLETRSIWDKKKIKNFQKALISQRNTNLQTLMDKNEV